MSFIGVLPERESLFQPSPRCDVGVNDAAAWRLNPAHRQVYDKLSLALDAGLRAAPCGVDPRDCGIAPDAQVFVKPIVNLAGMAVRARALPADAVPIEPGSFWCERLEGPHTSSDCLVQDGRAVWFAHTRGSTEKDRERPIYWEVGADLPDLEPLMADWVARHLKGYSGLCNLEMIGGRPIEVHLRGSNGFFDFYGPDFIPAWVALVDGDAFRSPPRIPGGFVISVFGEMPIGEAQREAAAEQGVRIDLDTRTADRAAILRCSQKDVGLEVLRRLTGRTLA
ncbi:hypothetical protein [Thiocapsa bogorovii]|uniref:hypothetical protein n=1 Tax=Thiocapsa bogorovii TaxID=521689 RepID=UPI001E5CF2C1|nr:hypothetical protein [Thiocapsa bogorovii]UHD16133.1 hypothetical protein LT988_23270 [Thiocapsa bogorovii]